MKTTEITVHAGRVIPHPFTSYSNLKPGLSYKAVLEDGEDPVEATKKLQAQAEGLLEDHCRHMIRSLEELEDLTRKQAKVQSLERSIKQAQADLDEIRNSTPDFTAIGHSPTPPRRRHSRFDESDDPDPDDEYDPEDKS